MGKNIILKKKSSNPLITQETSIMENPEPSKNYGVKKGSDHIREILSREEENLIMGKTYLVAHPT